MIIAIDGPAGSGKSSTAKEVARRLGFRHLDSGAFYRTLTLAALRTGIPTDAWDTLDNDALDELQVSARPADTGFTMLIEDMPVTDEIRSPGVTAHVSAMARVPAVRAWLTDRLRAAARGSDLVADGRDIGTVVFPQAQLKVFLSADPHERARRRLIQTGAAVTPEALEAEVRRIEARDRADAERTAAPLRQAPDARPLDTTGLSFDEQVAVIVDWARALSAKGG
jgi:cytidylate kinase